MGLPSQRDICHYSARGYQRSWSDRLSDARSVGSSSHCKSVVGDRHSVISNARQPGLVRRNAAELVDSLPRVVLLSDLFNYDRETLTRLRFLIRKSRDSSKQALIPLIDRAITNQTFLAKFDEETVDLLRDFDQRQLPLINLMRRRAEEYEHPNLGQIRRQIVELRVEIDQLRSRGMFQLVELRKIELEKMLERERRSENWSELDEKAFCATWEGRALRPRLELERKRAVKRAWLVGALWRSESAWHRERMARRRLSKEGPMTSLVVMSDVADVPYRLKSKQQGLIMPI